MEDDLRPEYDLSKLKNGVRGKYALKYKEGTNLIWLEPEVAEVFKDNESVNEALRLLIKIAGEKYVKGVKPVAPADSRRSVANRWAYRQPYCPWFCVGLMSAMTDTEIRMKGMQVLVNALGEVHAEKFITLILREPFNYTEWQRNLWNDKSVEEISRMAMQRRLKQGDWGLFTAYIDPKSIGINTMSIWITPFQTGIKTIPIENGLMSIWIRAK